MNAHTLESRLRTIEDRLAILDIEADYAHAWDLGTARQWAEVFTEDGVFEMLSAGNLPATRIAGHAALEAFCDQIREQWSGLHYMHPPRLRIAGDTAESVIFFEFRHVMRTDAHLRQGVTAGYYRTAYVRTGAGWRIRERIEQAIGEALSHFYPGDLAPPSACRHG
ncbi:MAG: nuclear transport factor 2 family protein [Rhodocyclaceae bacterium]|nr:nuclear transport factor 2 family protein [Rhodocyclaceae bacterium]MBK6554589.1 nuclear transport factor 2 family protein [Rhodocyclaceae bacterium]MBK6677476.1 nuclear transport factor 2 family protein [Rhodocyclaceae bacterium]MBK9310132.1 nuclear transport factor 2 family protein [Rhodocyclaceae bacterium]MBK9954795.1 nuclear transport factor 2 family protein [Rhodocyclaceae bacterium]